ncbi:MAG TPA: alpha/beta hydrolase [Pyrinomonadaceae bacterium]|nr:alpha/beta hydrolase [Pyrinomonadaceae bacterium]
MTAKRILFTNLADPLLGEVMFQYLSRTQDLVLCVGRPEGLPAKFDISRVQQRVAFVDWQHAAEILVDEVWQSSTPDHHLRVPVINHVEHGGEEANSSIEAELLKERRETGVNYRIFKPANLVDVQGDWPTPPVNDFYGVLAHVVSFKKDIEDKIEGYFQRRPLMIRSNLALDLLPIEEAARQMFEIAAAKDTLNRAHHIAGAGSVSLRNYLEVLAQNIGMQIEYVSAETSLDGIDAVFDSEISLAESETENISEPGPEPCQVIQSFLKSYSSEPPREEIGDLMALREVRLQNGEHVTYYAGGRGERTIVIVNAYAQGATYWTKFIRQLRDKYRLILWLPRDSGLEHLRTALANEQVESCAFVGWCTGPKLILDYYSSYPEQVTSTIFLGATFKNVPGQAQLDTDYERGLEPLLKMVQARPQLAGRLKVALQGVLSAGKMDDRNNVDDSTSVMQRLGFPCPDLKDAVMGPFATDEDVVNYADQIIAFWNHDVSKLFENVRVPVLFVTGDCDRIASPGMAQAAAQLIPGARYIEVKGGSHYLQYEKSSLTARIVDQFLRGAVARPHTYTRSA